MKSYIYKNNERLNAHKQFINEAHDIILYSHVYLILLPKYHSFFYRIKKKKKNIL